VIEGALQCFFDEFRHGHSELLGSSLDSRDRGRRQTQRDLLRAGVLAPRAFAAAAMGRFRLAHRVEKNREYLSTGVMLTPPEGEDL